MKEFPQDVITAPFGTWSSPLSAAEVHAGSAPIFDAAFRGEHIFYSTKVTTENSRTGLVRTSLSRPGNQEQILPPRFNIRSSVHEYGGSAWALDPGSEVVYFVNAADQRVWQMIPGRSPHALTPDTSGLIRYGDLRMTPWGLLCVREDNRSSVKDRKIVLLSRHGTASVLADHTHFLAWPRLSPDGRTLAFIGWEHPDMPWDSTSLWLVDIGAKSFRPGRDVRESHIRAVLHGRDVSLLQPEFSSDSTVLLGSDHGGHWALYSLDLSAPKTEFEVSDLTPVLDTGAEIGGALWQLGAKWYLRDDAEIWAHSQAATAHLIRLPTTGAASAGAPLESYCRTASGGHFGSIELHDLSSSHVLLTARSSTSTGSLVALDRTTGIATEIANERLDAHDEYFSKPYADELGGVPVVIHPPHNPRFVAPARELPPYVVIIHGGPTGQATPDMSARHSYFTSRGIGIIEVNYGGSTGYGRAWRERLRGNWGVVDVEDTVAAVHGLLDLGLADPHRIAICGASAGGWTVLSALASSDVFACGASYFGVTDLMKFVIDTHDFEKHYVDGLVGPWPEAHDAYVSRSPIRRVGEISVPVAIMQGDRDPIVPPSQAQEFVDMMELQGVRYIYRLYRGESHGFVRADSIIDSLESEFGFYADVFGIPRVRKHV